jgi:hypothetical protein
MSKDELEGARIVPNSVGPGVFQEHMQGMQRGSATQPVGPPAANRLQPHPTARRHSSMASRRQR